MNQTTKLVALALLVTAISAIKQSTPKSVVNLAYRKTEEVSLTHLVQAPTCPGPNEYIKCEGASNRYRTLDGTCNNLKYPWWGAVQTPYNRLVMPIPTCDVDAPRTDTLLDVSGLPTAEEVTALLPTNVTDDFVTVDFAYFGQFVANDLSSTIPAYVECECESSEPECFNIQLDLADQIRYGRQCLTKVRSLDSRKAFDCAFDHREQLSNVTHYLDLSNIYGSNAAQNKIVRTHVDGKLRTDLKVVTRASTPIPQNLLIPPILDINQCLTHGVRTSGCFYGADNQRSFIDPLITVIHTQALLEHNRFATELKKRNAHWSDNTLYQEARRLLIAVYQNIVYSQFLPFLIGEDKMKEFKLNPLTSGHGHFYNDYLYPNIYNEFAEAAFKLNNFIPNSVLTFRDPKYPVTEILSDLFWRQDLSYRDLEQYAIALLENYSGAGGFTTVMSLLKYAETPTSEDTSLPALVVQQGRDHALESYTIYRSLAGGATVDDFSDLTDIEPAIVALLASVYNLVSDIDLWMGLLAETRIEDAVVGKTQAFIIGKQFNMLKYGDRFYYENGEDEVNRFTEAQLNSIRGYPIQTLYCNYFLQNSAEEKYVTKSCYHPYNEHTNPMVSCSSFPDIDFDLWAEKRARYY